MEGGEALLRGGRERHLLLRKNHKGRSREKLEKLEKVKILEKWADEWGFEMK